MLRSSPSDPGASNNLGNIYKARGQLDSAEVSYRRALESDPRMAQAHNNLADLYRLSKRPRLAVLGSEVHPALPYRRGTADRTSCVKLPQLTPPAGVDSIQFPR